MTLDTRLEADSLLISSNGNWQTRLMNDSRWPWIIVIPLLAGVEDVDDYPPQKQGLLMRHLAEVSATLKNMEACTSTNVATLGNVVKQMHWHVVGRNESDPNWPGPIWGFEVAEPYTADKAEAFISSFKKVFRGTFD